MFRSLVVLAVVAVSAVSATNLGPIAGFPSPNLSNIKLAQRAPAPADGPYIAGFPVPRI